VLPIVLHHGLFGFGNTRIGPLPLRYFAGRIERAIAERGHPLIIGKAHPTGPIELRARQLKEVITRQLQLLGRSDTRVIILAHSLGGLDARFMISHLGMADRVAALVTLATPHRGSSYADWVVQNLGDRLGGTKLIAKLGIDLRAIADLTTTSMSRFNSETPDAPAVNYFSVAGVQKQIKCSPALLHSHRVVYKCEGENDGVVSLISAKWGKFLGTWPADHMHMVNKRFTPEALLPKNDVTPRYMALLENVEQVSNLSF
jgi:triacylglycerol lipase